MKFSKAETDIDHDIYCAISEGGGWKLGVRSVMFGVRVCLTKIPDCFYTLDYCAADQPEFALVLLATVSRILEQYPEDSSSVQLQRDFPDWEIRPINNDPNCWKKLQEMTQKQNEGER